MSDGLFAQPDNEKVSVMVEKFSDTEVSSVTLYLKFQRVYREIEKEYTRLFERFNLSESRFVILMFLNHEEHQQLSPSALAEKLNVTRATTTKLLNGLEKSGLITKQPSRHDGRSNMVKLTSEGKALLEDFLPYNYRAVKVLLEPFSEQEKKLFVQLLEKLLMGNLNLEKWRNKNYGNGKD